MNSKEECGDSCMTYHYANKGQREFIYIFLHPFLLVFPPLELQIIQALYSVHMLPFTTAQSQKIHPKWDLENDVGGHTMRQHLGANGCTCDRCDGGQTSTWWEHLQGSILTVSIVSSSPEQSSSRSSEQSDNASSSWWHDCVPESVL